MERKSFLRTLGAGAAGSSLLPLSSTLAAGTDNAPYPSPFHVKLGISTYSYWHFYPERTPIRHVIDEAARLGVNGIDILHRQMESEDPAYIRSLKRHALQLGIDLNCLSTHQDFVNPDPEERRISIDDTKRFIRLAHDLGISCIRISAGRWNTSESFAALMANDGIEPPIEGYTEDDAYEWCIDAIGECLPFAEEHGVVLGLENHWGMTRTAEGVLRILNEFDSPWIGVLLDTGNFLERKYEQMEMLAPYTVFVQAKTYYGGGRFYTLDLDYHRIASILNNAGYKGYISIEFEGHEESATAVEKSIQMLRHTFSGYEV
jgi:L-ribulose-5-phosphate 3-epimerase